MWGGDAVNNPNHASTSWGCCEHPQFYISRVKTAYSLLLIDVLNGKLDWDYYCRVPLKADKEVCKLFCICNVQRWLIELLYGEHSAQLSQLWLLTCRQCTTMEDELSHSDTPPRAASALSSALPISRYKVLQSISELACGQSVTGATLWFPPGNMHPWAIWPLQQSKWQTRFIGVPTNFMYVMHKSCQLEMLDLDN